MTDISAFDEARDIENPERSAQRGVLRQAPSRRLAATRLVAIDGFGTGELPSSDDFEQIDLDYDASNRALWCYLKPMGAPSFTPGLLRDLNSLHATLARRDLQAGTLLPLYYVVRSRLPGIFNLGGDLALFVDRIRAGDADGLRRYAQACCQAVHAVATGFGGPIVTIGLMEGNALGGGLEGALSFHVLIAERGVKFGFPEMLFGSFPGMGAYSFLSRRIGMREAEKIILSGKIYSAEEFHELGLVDILVPKGGGEDAARSYLASNRSRHALAHAHQRIRQKLNPLTLQELYDITEIWVETAMALSAGDLRRMERLVAAQNRQNASS